MIEDRKESEEQQKGVHISNVSISGVHDANIAVGEHIQQRLTGRVSDVEVDALRQAFASLLQQVEVQAPPEQRGEAIKMVNDLGQAVAADKPDLDTMEKVKRWFGSHVPALADAVTRIVTNPSVLKLAGDALEMEFKRRFGG